MSDSAEKSLPASPRKRRETRAKGQVAVSQLLGPALLLLAATAALHFGGPGFAQGMGGMLQQELQAPVPEQLTIGSVAAQIRGLVGTAAKFLLPVALGVWLTCVTQGLLQTQFLFTWQPLKPKLATLNPVPGWRRLMGGGTWLKGGAIVLQLLAAGAITWTFLSPSQLVELDGAAARGTAALAAQMGHSAVSLAFRLSVTATVLALLDFGWQLWTYERSIRMTADEMREELRLSEGNPQVKGARRERQRELAGSRKSV